MFLVCRFVGCISDLLNNLKQTYHSNHDFDLNSVFPSSPPRSMCAMQDPELVAQVEAELANESCTAAFSKAIAGGQARGLPTHFFLGAPFLQVI